MHEASTMRDVVNTVNERARQAGGTRVLHVELSLGPIGHLTEAATRQAFAAMAAGTMAAGASITITAMPSAYQCTACGHRFTSFRHEPACPVCGGPVLAPPGQDGCYIGDVEITTTDDDHAGDTVAAHVDRS